MKIKELSIEEKAKRYDEAIGRAIKHRNNDGLTLEQYETIEIILPELKSEDERIRKEIVRFIQMEVEDEIVGNEWLSWLEKRGEQKPTDKVEPKFKVGDKIRKKTPSSFDRDMQVARIEKDYYVCNHIGKFSSEVVPFSKESSYELVEQKPTEKPVWYDNMDDLIADGMIDEIQKSDLPEGSKHNRIYWINKHRVYPQPRQEWSEDDEQYLLVCKNALAKYQTTDKWDASIIFHWLENKLKSLRPHSTWKPSCEQMKFLQKYAEQNNYDGRILTSLYNDLKKLKGI